ncbi:MAG: hypothetical protein DRP56_09960, partial [Planctomycetota bacterium]
MKQLILSVVLLLSVAGWALNPETGISLVKLAFDQYYEDHYEELQNYAEPQQFYYFRYEAQALIDMYNATGDDAYLARAKTIAQKAIADAIANPVEVTYGNDSLGSYPCFTHLSSMDHTQLTDFQGGLGLLIIAEELKAHGDSYYQTICDFVETNLVDKWFKRIRRDFAAGPEYDDFYAQIWSDSDTKYDIVELVIDGARDKREMFGLICLILKQMGYTLYPYEDYSDYMFTQAFTIRPDVDAPDWPYNTDIHKSWGLMDQGDGTIELYWMTQFTYDYYPVKQMSTRHASRTVWSAVEAYQRGTISQAAVTALVATFKKKMWDPAYVGQSYTGDPRLTASIDPNDYYPVGPNYFFVHNQTDGTDLDIKEAVYGYVQQPGRHGTIAMGWHRLAQYDNDIKTLLSRIADDLVYDELMGRSSSVMNRIFSGYANVDGEVKLCGLAYGARVKRETNTDWSVLAPVEISTIEQLQQVNLALDGNYILTQDINASQTNPSDPDFDPNGTWGDGEGFDPLGNRVHPFTGTLNGQGYTISGLYINRPTETREGLFGVNQGTSTNIQLIDCDITDRFTVVEINNVEQLQQINLAKDRNYVLTQDIDASQTNPSGTDYDPSGTWGDRKGFKPLGDASVPFTGTLNGQGFTINGLYINRPTETRVGLFGNNQGMLTNVHITDCQITGSGYTGAVAGLNNAGAIASCSAAGSVESHGTRVGGLVGYNLGPNASIVDCYSQCDVEGNGNDRIGGLVGINYNGAAVANCYATGTVTSSGGSMVREFVGYTPDDGTVTNCFYAGTGSYRGC